MIAAVGAVAAIAVVVLAVLMGPGRIPPSPLKPSLWEARSKSHCGSCQRGGPVLHV